jgi:hypothetical protein
VLRGDSAENDDAHRIFVAVGMLVGAFALSITAYALGYGLLWIVAAIPVGMIIGAGLGYWMTEIVMRLEPSRGDTADHDQ